MPNKISFFGCQAVLSAIVASACAKAGPKEPWKAISGLTLTPYHTQFVGGPNEPWNAIGGLTLIPYPYPTQFVRGPKEPWKAIGSLTLTPYPTQFVESSKHLLRVSWPGICWASNIILSL